MKHQWLLFVALFHSLLITTCASNSSDAEEIARNYVDDIMPNVEKNVIWTEELITKDRLKLSFIDLLGLEYDVIESIDFLRNITATLKQYNYENFKNELLKAKIKALFLTDHKILPEKERNEMDDLITESESIKNDVKICMPSQEEPCALKFDDISEYVHELPEKDKIYYWIEWRKRAGKIRKDKLSRYLELYRKASKLNGFSKPSQQLFHDYEIPGIIDKLTNAISELKPLYKQLHAFIRHKLREHYDSSILRKQPLPDHLIDEFSYKFRNLESISASYYPFPNASLMTYTDRIETLNYTAQGLLKQAFNFYKSMDMFPDFKPSPSNTVILNPEVDDDDCETSILNLFNSTITLICPNLTFDNFLKIHSELVEWQRSESVGHLDLILRINLWSGYSKIFKNTMRLSAFSTSYLQKVNLETSTDISYESKINRLYREALKLIPLINAFIEGKLFVELLDDKININVTNCEFWNLKEKYLGSQPPVTRTQNDFDFLATKFDGFEKDDWEDVLAEIISFKLYEGLCNKTEDFVENSSALNECDFSDSKNVGLALKNAMQWGNVKPWPEHFKEILGDLDISSKPILNYFQPLQDWLEEYHNKTDIYVGWDKEVKCN